MYNTGIKYEIMIGIKDKDTYQEILTVDDFKNIFIELCIEKQISFSLIKQYGGYTHNKGYTTETSLRVIIIGIDENEMIQLSEKLKKAVNTDTILITKSEIEYSFM